MSKKENNQTEHVSTSQALDDEQRVKSLSPTLLVMKRFLRNRLALVGLWIIAIMFVFSFIGGIFSPYGEKQIFTKMDYTQKDYATVTENSYFRYAAANDSVQLTDTFKAAFLQASGSAEGSFENLGITYSYQQIGDDFYLISGSVVKAEAMYLMKELKLSSGELTDEELAAFSEAVANKETEFELNGVQYVISQNGKSYTLGCASDIATASMYVYDMPAESEEPSYEFRLNCELAVNAGETTFEADGVTYSIETGEDEYTITLNGEIYTVMSHMAVSPISNDVELSLEYKEAAGTAVAEMMEQKVTEYTFTFDGVDYDVDREDTEFTISSSEETQLIDMYAYPSKTHWLGTDANGMDILTRLMYGGRISLIISFVGIFLELVIGIIIGGISGYFGKIVDTICMRIVDIFNCLPTMPILIILGSILDALNVDAKTRIYILMLVLGILNWPGIARMVRGQILSLREQEFMTAAEATGISVKRRIFRHLIPNVAPQLIVVATMGLGDIILTESSLSFLGLGVKYPYASWGNIISAVSNVYVMTNYWFVWIPAGLLILLTVLGFNFIGDGLRDAFDPKMKR